ncbi:hypothetical protein X777_11908 [Ooceraea biroi]|uniref:Uncharacterized protein n=1 Tax=Ooceraea biroi TaxID=2015173 RepID=A0A026W0E4_OOCBI|nr:hypothetical protein X777_11908 [Ooceraea biroi]
MNGSLGIARGPEQHPQRFTDYFVVCGLDKDSGLEPDKYFGEHSGGFVARLRFLIRRAARDEDRVLRVIVISAVSHPRPKGEKEREREKRKEG